MVQNLTEKILFPSKNQLMWVVFYLVGYKVVLAVGYRFNRTVPGGNVNGKFYCHWSSFDDGPVK